MKRKLFALGATAVLALAVASCDGGEETGGKVIKLEYSGTASNKEFNMSLFEDFKAAQRALGDTTTYEISYVEHGPDAVDSEVADWVVGPDVFEFASDKLGVLYEKGALARISGPNADFIEENNSEIGKEIATFNGDYYAYPYTGDNTYYLQYDKSIFSEDDVKTMEGLLDKAAQEGVNIGYELETAFWSAGALFTFGADYHLTYDADGAVVNIEADFDTDKGLKAAKAIYKIMNYTVNVDGKDIKPWQNAMSAPTPSNGLGGCIAGTWDISKYKKELKDNYACAPMPTITIDGVTEHLGAFLGGKLFGINPQRSQGNADRLAAAHKLAKFLSGKECQLRRFDDQGVGPCNLEASAEERVKNDANIKCLYEQQKFAHSQVIVPASIWTAPNVLTAGIKAGDTTLDNLQEAMNTLNQSIKGSK